MTLKQAISYVIHPEVLGALRGHSSPPEILKIAALECFRLNYDGEVADVIRKSFNHLHTVGGLDEQIF